MNVLQAKQVGLVIGELAATSFPALFPGNAAMLCARAGLGAAVDSAISTGFDIPYYESVAGRKFNSASGALFHYLFTGSRRGLGPNADFDPAYYRRANPDVALAGYEPFAHYLHFGRHEGREGRLGADRSDEASVTAPDIGRMLSRIRSSELGDVAVDVVIPVYGSRALTLQAIDSVLAARTVVNHEIVVVDDASPDPALRDDLGRLAGRRLITLLTNERNVGFVESVNRGMALHPERDIVLLNSDTKVHGNWLDRLLGVLRGAPRVGTATPLSNAATILSYPIRLRDNNAIEIDDSMLDQFCARLALAPVELPTAIGFCMAISRRCLDAVGPFDVVRFGRGYGEENDFCLRASALGWRHLAAANVFVWHRGGASFGVERDARIAAAQNTLEQLHPGYRSKIRRFIRSDKLSPIRAALDVARIVASWQTKILQIGSSANADMMGAGQLLIRLVPDVGPHFGKYRLMGPDFFLTPNLPRIDRSTSIETIAAMMKNLGIIEVRMHPTVLSLAFRSRLAKAAKTMGIIMQEG